MSQDPSSPDDHKATATGAFGCTHGYFLSLELYVLRIWGVEVPDLQMVSILLFASYSVILINYKVFLKKKKSQSFCFLAFLLCRLKAKIGFCSFHRISLPPSSYPCISYLLLPQNAVAENNSKHLLSLRLSMGQEFRSSLLGKF